MATNEKTNQKERYWLAIALAIVGTAVGTFFAIWSAFDKPKERLYWWLLLIVVSALSIVAGILVNFPSIQQLRHTKRLKAEAEEKYDELRKKIALPLSEGLDSLLRRAVRNLLPAPTATEQLVIHPEEDLALYSFVLVEDRYRIVSSTSARSAVVRHITLDHGEGVVGLAFEVGAPIITELLPDKTGKVTYRAGDKVSEQPRRLSDGNLAKCDPGLKWIYALPILEGNAEDLKRESVLGVLTVDCTKDGGCQIFRDVVFQRNIEILASELVPHLLALRTLGVIQTSVT